jgi:hypothetical protein
MTTIRRAAAAAMIALSLTACEDILEVNNPAALQEEQLANPALEQFMINGAIGEFQFAYVSYVLWSGVLADELFTDHTNVSVREFSLHNFNDLNATNEGIYNNLQRARQSADDAVERVKVMAGAGAASSLNVARALIYGGYSYVLLAEGFCEAPVNLSAPLPSAELFTRAVARFDEGIAVATAGRTGTNVAAAQDLIYMAQVGAARASLKKGDAVRARTYAAPVPDSYERLAYYSANSVRENNAVNAAVRTSGAWLSMAPAYQGVSDTRAPQPTASRPGLNSNPIFPPLKPSMYSGWTGTGTPQTIEITNHIRFASGLEARYIGVEADGPNAAMLTFVNARRAVAGKTPVNLTGAELLAEFRVQRSLDFYLTGQRLGDLRRYAAAGTNLFPTGKYPVFPDPYGSATCFVVPQSEKSGNPTY